MHIQDENKFNNIEKYRKNEEIIRQPEQILLTVTGNAWKPGQRRQIWRFVTCTMCLLFFEINKRGL